MSAHAFFSPSKANMWMTCAGAMAFRENQVEGKQNDFADEGSAAHHFAALCLKHKHDASDYIGGVVKINEKLWACTEDMASAIQVYLDDVRRRVGSGMLFVEHKVDLQKWLGKDQFGTADVIIINPEERLIVVEDLKFGRGERVYAYDANTDEVNKQIQLYALGAIEFAELFVDVHGTDGWKVQLVISQPRIDHAPSETTIVLNDLLNFGMDAAQAVRAAMHLVNAEMRQPPEHSLRPSEKGCRWCAVRATCPALAAKIQAEVQVEFETIEVTPPQLPMNDQALSMAYAAVPLIQNWVRAVEAIVYERVAAGKEITGSDGHPLKMVEGRQGSRQWIDPAEAETVLLGALPREKVYEAPHVISASVASKLLDKKATKDVWKEYFVPLIRRAPGKPVLALHSDERPQYVGDVTAEFTEIQPEE